MRRDGTGAIAGGWKVPGRLMRAPALRFLAIGGVIFGLVALRDRTTGPELALPEPLVLRVGDVLALRARWRRDLGVDLRGASLAAAVERYVDEELLFREARRLGLHRLDTAVRARLLDNMEFVAGEGDAAQPGQMVEEAHALGLDEQDPVVRRTLVEKMKLLAGKPRAERPPTDDELRAFHAEHGDRWMQPARIRFAQVFLSRERHGKDLERAARDLALVVAGPAAWQRDALVQGDAFPLGTAATEIDQARVRQRFGPEFAHAVFALAPGRWQGPVPSSYGLHFVWIEERTPGALQPFATVRVQVEQALAEQRTRHHLARALTRLRRLYAVRIELPAEPASAPSTAGAAEGGAS